MTRVPEFSRRDCLSLIAALSGATVLAGQNASVRAAAAPKSCVVRPGVIW